MLSRVQDGRGITQVIGANGLIGRAISQVHQLDIALAGRSWRREAFAGSTGTTRGGGPIRSLSNHQLSPESSKIQASGNLASTPLGVQARDRDKHKPDLCRPHDRIFGAADGPADAPFCTTWAMRLDFIAQQQSEAQVCEP